MKDPFGNDISIKSMDVKNVESESIHNNKDKSMADKDMDRNNLENSINIHGESAYTNGDERRIGHESDKVLVGIFETVHEANNVINRLKEIGYDENDITVIAKDKDKMDRLEGDSNNMGKGAAIGGTLGGLAAALPALGVLAIPGIGPVLAAGPIAVILGGVVAGSLAGGFIGALTEMGIDKAAARDYAYQLEQGRIIVLVDNDENLRDDVYETYRENNALTDINAPKL